MIEAIDVIKEQCIGLQFPHMDSVDFFLNIWQG